MTAHKPDGYPSASPYLIVDGAAGTIDFLVRALDGVEIERQESAAGGVLHAAVRIDDSVVMLTDGVSPDWPPQPAHVHVYVRDVDATYARALAAGATPVQEPLQKDDPDKRGGVRDAGGTTWWIATQMS